MQTLTRAQVPGESAAGSPASSTTSGEGGHPLPRVLALLSAGAAALHFAFAPEHLDEDWLHGGFFMVVAWL